MEYRPGLSLYGKLKVILLIIYCLALLFAVIGAIEADRRANDEWFPSEYGVNKMEKGDKYRCDFTVGDGHIYSEGEWIVKVKTDKTLVMEKITEQEIYDYYEKGDTLKIGSKHGNPVEFHGDGTFTAYPDQSGTPFCFEPIKEKEEIVNSEPLPLF